MSTTSHSDVDNDPVTTAMAAMDLDATIGEAETANLVGNGRVRQPLEHITHLLMTDPSSEEFVLPNICRPGWHQVGRDKTCGPERKSISKTGTVTDKENTPTTLKKVRTTITGFFNKVTKSVGPNTQDTLIAWENAHPIPGDASPSSGYVSSASEQASPGWQNTPGNAFIISPNSFTTLQSADTTFEDTIGNDVNMDWEFGENKNNEDSPFSFSYYRLDSEGNDADIEDNEDNKEDESSGSEHGPKPLARFPPPDINGLSPFEAHQIELNEAQRWNNRSRALLNARGIRGRRMLLGSRRISDAGLISKNRRPALETRGSHRLRIEYGLNLGEIAEEEDIPIWEDECDRE
ncbi:hypothetical protein QBC44DRAFT_304229 [Cladorrhinum sp. PSN332]|nr:hypothetical protein QBC44DRAFT_304229 [Cladorrhinum sp. PSN332]